MRFGFDQFTHSTISGDAADNSPTVWLVRYLIDLAHEAGVVDDSHSTSKVMMNAHNWLKTADDELPDDPDDLAYAAILEKADPVITDLTNLLPGTTSLHSLVINWSDHDTDQGTFGTTVRALSHDHAEYLARAEMERSEDAGSDFTGEVVDHNVGANWKADDLEKSLRGLLAWVDSQFRSTAEPEAIASARKLIAEIDAIA